MSLRCLGCMQQKNDLLTGRGEGPGGCAAALVHGGVDVATGPLVATVKLPLELLLRVDLNGVESEHCCFWLDCAQIVPHSFSE